MSAADAAGVIRRHADRLLALPGVVGVAEGSRDGRACVLVLVTRKTADLVAAVPQALEGIPTALRETGVPEAFGPDCVPPPSGGCET